MHSGALHSLDEKKKNCKSEEIQQKNICMYVPIYIFIIYKNATFTRPYRNTQFIVIFNQKHAKTRYLYDILWIAEQ